MSTRAEAVNILTKSRTEPAWFLTEVLGVPYITPQQQEVIDSVARNRRTAVTAGNGVGKTWLAARLALWFLYTNPGAKVVTTAPTWFQCREPAVAGTKDRAQEREVPAWRHSKSDIAQSLGRVVRGRTVDERSDTVSRDARSAGNGRL
jgi:hypothetical protein